MDPLSSRETRILWGVVPSALQEAILAELHEYTTHEGLVARNERRHRDNCLVMCRMPNGTRYPPLHLCAPGIGQHAVRLCWTHKRTNVLGADRRPFQYSLFKGTASFVCQVWATGRNSPCPRFEWASRTSGPNREATRLAKFLFALSVGTTGVSHA